MRLDVFGDFPYSTVVGFLVETQFVTDIAIEGCLFAATIRSPAACGRVTGINCPPMPETYRLITARDVPGVNQLDELPVRVLAEGAVAYIGEPVALLVGPDEVKAGEYALLCEVAVEEPQAEEAPPEEAVFAERSIVIGDAPDAAKVKATVSGIYKTGIQEHWYAEPHAAVASFDERFPDRIVIHTATQWPFQVKRSVAKVLSIQPEMVEVISTRLGTHLDGKIWYPSLIASLAALGAFITGKPVKLALTREEDFRYSPKRNAAEIQITSSLGENNELLGTEIKVRADLGAFGAFADEILDRVCLASLDSYRLPFVKIDAAAVKTNTPPAGPLAGFGLSQGFFAMGLHASRIADLIRVDPADWRKQHLLRKNDSLAIGIPIKEPVTLQQVLDTASKMGDYARKWASYELLRLHRRQGPGVKDTPLRGIGIAGAYQGSGFLYSGQDKAAWAVEATLGREAAAMPDTPAMPDNGKPNAGKPDADKSDGLFLEIKTSAAPSNGSLEAILQNLAGKILSMEPEKVKISMGDASVAPDSGPSSNSRNIAIITKLVERCCLAIKKQRSHDELPFTVRRSYKPAKAKAWGGKICDLNAFSSLSWGAAAVEIEIETATYIPKIRGLWMCIDGGRILSENGARKSLKTAAIQALGWASREQLAYVDGRIPNESIYNYDIPAPADGPSVEIAFIDNGSAAPKGIGELAFSTIPAAYVQAVSQALDHPFEKIPLSAQDIWAAEGSKQEEK